MYRSRKNIRLDSINTYSYGRADREIIDKQLKNLDLNVSKKLHEEYLESVEDKKLPLFT